jgi:acetylornithine deacetylase/succinyl-diaminopimelate desuccinylase-like protein
MKVIVSCHCDSVFLDPFARVIDGMLIGACDNIAGILACAQLVNEGIHIEFTEDEERHMEGARYVAKRHSSEDTFFIVVDVTTRGKQWDKINFTVENFFGIQVKHIKAALRGLSYKLVTGGAESEAWLYKELGFACLEIDIPVIGGLHSLDGKARVGDILGAAAGIKALHNYLQDKERSKLSDPYTVG